MSKHTPTPWHKRTPKPNPKRRAGRVTHWAIGIEGNKSSTGRGLPHFTATAIGENAEECKANAEHIVRCVNAHEALKGIVELVAVWQCEFLDGECEPALDFGACVPCQARAALKLAEGE